VKAYDRSKQTNTGFYGQEGETPSQITPKHGKRMNKPPRAKQTLKVQVQKRLEEVDSNIQSLSQYSDPYQFQQQIAKLDADLQAQENSLNEKSEVASEEKALQRLHLDYETVSSRLSDLEEQRKALDLEVTQGQQDVRDLEEALQVAVTQLKQKQRELVDVGKIRLDSRQEGETIARSIEEAKVRLENAKKTNHERQECLQLVRQCRANLNQTAEGLGSLEKAFLASWREWDHRQMIDWLCGLKDAYQEYRSVFQANLPKQVDDGSDFEVFDKHVLLGLGVEKIRHRHDMMKSISQLIAPGNSI